MASVGDKAEASSPLGHFRAAAAAARDLVFPTRSPTLGPQHSSKRSKTDLSGCPTVSRPKIRLVPCTPWFQQPTELILLACVLKRAMDLFLTRSSAEPIRSLDSERFERFQVPDVGTASQFSHPCGPSSSSRPRGFRCGSVPACRNRADCNTEPDLLQVRLSHAPCETASPGPSNGRTSIG
jgi:hypothetical protein